MTEEANDELAYEVIEKDREPVTKRQSGQNPKLIVRLYHIDVPDGGKRLCRAIEILLKSSATYVSQSREIPPGEVVTELPPPHGAQRKRHI